MSLNPTIKLINSHQLHPINIPNCFTKPLPKKVIANERLIGLMLYNY